VLKGTGPLVRLVVEPVLSSQDYPAVQERQYGIFFLQRQPGGSYAVTDPFHPALVASPQWTLLTVLSDIWAISHT
jgi:hypothetical protein